MSFILELTQAGVTTFYATIVPPPAFLTGFGQIRKLALVRNGGGGLVPTGKRICGYVQEYKCRQDMSSGVYYVLMY